MSDDLVPQPPPGGQFLVYRTEDGKLKLDVRFEGETVWLTQAHMAELFQTSVPNVSMHIRNVFAEAELPENSVVKESLTTAADGKRYATKFYNLDVIISVGYRVKSLRGTQFRIWATQRLREFIVKGFVLDDERLKNPDLPFDYFEELLRRIQDIRTAERRFYQKITDIYATSIDYDPTQEVSIRFFKTVQNKVHWAITGQTAAEIVVSRADPNAPNMALTNWSGSRVRKHDVTVAKNYLSGDEVDTLNRLVVIFLEQAELRVKERKQLTLDYWRQNVDRLLDFNEKAVLTHAGSVSREAMERIARERFDAFDENRRIAEARQADAEEIAELARIEKQLEQKKDKR